MMVSRERAFRSLTKLGSYSIVLIRATFFVRIRSKMRGSLRLTKRPSLVGGPGGKGVAVGVGVCVGVPVGVRVRRGRRVRRGVGVPVAVGTRVRVGGRDVGVGVGRGVSVGPGDGVPWEGTQASSTSPRTTRLACFSQTRRVIRFPVDVGGVKTTPSCRRCNLGSCVRG